MLYTRTFALLILCQAWNALGTNYRLIETETDFLGAVDACEQLGGNWRLATPRTSRQLLSASTSLGEQLEAQPWVGAIQLNPRDGPDKNWVWNVDGDQLNKPSFPDLDSLWAVGEPNDSNKFNPYGGGTPQPIPPLLPDLTTRFNEIRDQQQRQFDDIRNRVDSRLPSRNLLSVKSMDDGLLQAMPRGLLSMGGFEEGEDCAQLGKNGLNDVSCGDILKPLCECSLKEEECGSKVVDFDSCVCKE